MLNLDDAFEGILINENVEHFKNVFQTCAYCLCDRRPTETLKQTCDRRLTETLKQTRRILILIKLFFQVFVPF